MKLHTYWRSSSAYRVRIALSFKGLPYDSRSYTCYETAANSIPRHFLAKNPLGQIPVLELEDGGKEAVLTQSVAIIEYLEERYPSPPLLPKDLLARARARELSQLIQSGIQPFQNTGTTAFLAEVAPELDKQRWFERFIGRGLASLEARAGALSGQFLVGDEVSIADVLLVPQLYAARRLDLPLGELPTLLAIEARCLALPGFVAAHPDRQPDRE